MLLQGADCYTAAEIPAGLYPGLDEAVPSIGGKAVMATTADTDSEVVYQLVKAVFDNLDRFKRLHPAFADLIAEDMIRVGLTAPLHEGAENSTRSKAGSNARVACRAALLAKVKAPPSRPSVGDRYAVIILSQAQPSVTVPSITYGAAS